MNIGVVSDTHVRSLAEIPEDILRALSTMDMIIHAGDFIHPDVLTGLQELGEVKAVCGNMDTGVLRDILPLTEELSIHGKKIEITHGWGDPWGLEMKLSQKFEDADVIIYGHTHQARNDYNNGILFFNPGPGSRSFGILTISENTIAGKLITI